jgi:hypothetical protein
MREEELLPPLPQQLAQTRSSELLSRLFFFNHPSISRTLQLEQ